MHVCVCVCGYGKYQNPNIYREGILIGRVFLCKDVCAFKHATQIHRNRMLQDAWRMTYPQTHIWILSLKLGIHMQVCECVCGYDKNQS